MQPDIIDTDLVVPADTPLAVQSKSEVGQLIELALRQGQNPTELYAILAEERKAQAVFAFNRALAKFQQTCPPIPRSREASFATRGGAAVSYTYAPIEQIAQTVQPVLHALGLSYGWDAEVGAGNIKVTCTLRHEGGHQQTATITLPTSAKSDLPSDQQKVAMALTFGKRQTLTSVLGVTTTDEDHDGAEVGEQLETVTEDQARTLNDLILQVGADRAKFLAWALPTVAESDRKLSAIPARMFDTAAKMLNAKAKKA